MPKLIAQGLSVDEFNAFKYFSVAKQVCMSPPFSLESEAPPSTSPSPHLSSEPSSVKARLKSQHKKTNVRESLVRQSALRDSIVFINESIGRCYCRLSGNSISLISAGFLFLLIASFQYYYGVLIKSTALTADSVTMGIDALAYFGNLIVENIQSEERKKIFELVMSGLSHSILIGCVAQNS